jgi:hypothetical protein
MSYSTDKKIPVYVSCTDTLVRVKIQITIEDPSTCKVHIVKEITEDLKPGDKQFFSFAAHGINEPIGPNLPTYAELGQADFDGTLFKDCKEATTEEAEQYRDSNTYQEVQFHAAYETTDRDLPDSERYRQATVIQQEWKRESDQAFKAKRARDLELIIKSTQRRQVAQRHGFDPDTALELENPTVLAGVLRKSEARKNPTVKEHTESEEEIKEILLNQSRKRAALKKQEKGNEEKKSKIAWRN